MGGYGADYKKNSLRKRTKRSVTSGRAKGIVPNFLDKYMAKRGRSYRHKLYSNWCLKYDGIRSPRNTKKG